MKIALPTAGYKGLDEKIVEHFGRASTYTIFDTETNEVKIIDNTGEHYGGSVHSPEIIKREGVDIVICSSLGPRAFKMFEEFGIEAFIGASGTVKDVIDDYKNGRLTKMNDANACKEHRHD